MQRQDTRDLAQLAMQTARLVRASVDEIAPDRAVGHIIDLISEANRYISDNAPWVRLKEASADPDARESLYAVLEAVRGALG